MVLRLVAMSLLALVVVAGCDEDCPTVPEAGTVAIAPEPDGIDAPWQLTGPDGYDLSGVGNATLPNLLVGDYTLTWGVVTDWETPSPATVTRALAADGSLTFTGTYVLQAGSITIDPEPDSIDAPWQLAGPGGFSRSGTGNTTLTDLAVGDYTLTWGAVAGWTTPAPTTSTQTLTADGTLTFAGSYRSASLPFPATPEQLVANFVTALTTRDLAAYRDEVLHPSYRFVLQVDTVEEFGLPDNLFEFADELSISERMFSGQPNSVGGILDDIEIPLLQPQGAWLEVPASDPYFGGVGALVRNYNVLMYFNMQGAFRYEVRGDCLVYILADTVEHDGVPTTRYRLLGQLDMTATKSTETVSWGDVKALFR